MLPFRILFLVARLRRIGELFSKGLMATNMTLKGFVGDSPNPKKVLDVMIKGAHSIREEQHEICQGS